jgi:hypothetical protein
MDQRPAMGGDEQPVAGDENHQQKQYPFVTEVRILHFLRCSYQGLSIFGASRADARKFVADGRCGVFIHNGVNTG